MYFSRHVLCTIASYRETEPDGAPEPKDSVKDSRPVIAKKRSYGDRSETHFISRGEDGDALKSELL